jgi:hypothetical protein
MESDEYRNYLKLNVKVPEKTDIILPGMGHAIFCILQQAPGAAV